MNKQTRTRNMLIGLVIAICIIAVLLILRGLGVFSGTGATSSPAASSSGAAVSSGTASSSAAQPEEETYPVILYVPDEQAESLIPVGTQTTDRRAAAIVALLIEAGALPKECEVLSCTQKADVLTIDMNAAFGEAVRAGGTAGETMLVYSLVDTLLQQYNATQAYLTVEGKTLETGHTIFDSALTKHSNLLE